MIEHLFHITHLSNVPGILKNGLLSRNRIESLSLPYTDLSDASCQARRSARQLNGSNIDLHDYVPLFIEPRNAMLYRLQKSAQEQGMGGDLVILEINADAAKWGASLLADGIASSPATHLFRARDKAGWEALDWNAIRCRSWFNQPDPQAAKRHKMAEVMVNKHLDCRHIEKMWLHSPSALDALSSNLEAESYPDAMVDEDRRLFF